jgi:GNAT superfamily N-acetyltransferase
MIRRFEEISNNAWPALQTLQYDGWTLRFAHGVTKRSNSVSLLYPSQKDAGEKIDFCESVYRHQGIVPCFKITEIAQPGDIDQRLSDRGYFIHSYISFQTSALNETCKPDIPGLAVESDLNPAWIGEFIRMNRFDSARLPVYEAIMRQVMTPKCLVSVQEGVKTVAVGLGVLEGAFVGIFDLVVDPDFRQKGLARKVMDAILFWGAQNGAATAYLQVLTDNEPALQLYRSMGFREIYRYWYRMAGN